MNPAGKSDKNVAMLRTSESAFTLVEVLFGALFVAILFISFFAALNFGALTTRMSREDLRATQILVSHMEGIRLFRWDQLTDTNLLPRTFTDYFSPDTASDSSITDKGITYNGTITVTNASLNPSATYSTNIYQITVQVQWSHGSVMCTRQMAAYQAMNGVQNYVLKN